MKEKISNNKKIIISTISIIIFLLILKDVFDNEITSYDEWAYGVFVENLRSSNMTVIMKILTSLGSFPVLAIVILAMLLFLKNKKNALFASLDVGIIFIINAIIKAMVQRPRPSGYNIIVESNYSFPSGHSMVSTAFYGFLIYLIYKNVKNKKIKYLMMSFLFLIIVSICISRVYLGVHYLSDTIAGFLISGAYLMMFVSFVPRLDNFLSKKKK